MRQIVLAQAKKHPEVLPVVSEMLDKVGICFEALLQRGRQVVLHQVRQLLEERPKARPPLLGRLPDGEELLELVKDQHQAHWLAFGAGETSIRAMEVLPEDFLGTW